MKRSLLVVMLLSACSTTNPPVKPLVQTVEKPVLVSPPDRLFRCELVRYPDPDNMTDKDLARFILALDTNLRVCKGNMDSLREFYRKAKRTVTRK